MKKSVVLGLGLCVALSFSACKSSESSYKKAYEKAKQKELAEAQAATPAEETVQVPETAVVAAPVEAPRVVESVAAPVRQENTSDSRNGKYPPGISMHFATVAHTYPARSHHRRPQSRSTHLRPPLRREGAPRLHHCCFGGKS